MRFFKPFYVHSMFSFMEKSNLMGESKLIEEKQIKKIDVLKRDCETQILSLSYVNSLELLDFVN